MGSVELLSQVAFCNPEDIPTYDEELVFLVMNEILEHYSKIKNLIKIATLTEKLPLTQKAKVDLTKFCHRSILTSYKIHIESILRKKQLLLVYHDSRLNLLRYLKWNNISPTNENATSFSEKEYLKKLDGIINIYKREVGLDLYKSYVPLEDPVVRVLTIEDLGEITFSSIGIIRLKKDSLHLLLRDDVEPFIQSGKLILF